MYKKVFQRLKEIAISMFIFYFFISTILLGYMTFNSYHHNFFGINIFKGILLFSTTAHLIDFESTKNKEIKKKIKPFIMKYKKDILGKSDGAINWVVHTEAGPRKIMEEFAGSYTKYDELCYDLSIEAIKKHPIEFFSRGFGIFFYTTLSGGVEWKFKRDYRSIIKESWQYISPDLFNALPKDHWQKLHYKDVPRHNLIQYNSTHPKAGGESVDYSFVNPFSSIGSFVRFFLFTSSITRLLFIWTLGAIIAFYFLFIRYKVFPVASFLTAGYLILVFHLGTHSMMSQVTYRYVYPILPIMMFFTILGFAKLWESVKSKGNQSLKE